MPRRNRTWAIQEQHRRIIAAAETCGICGGPLDKTLPRFDPGAPVVDHILAVALGGTEADSNKQAAHRACNATKGARPYAPIVKRTGVLR